MKKIIIWLLLGLIGVLAYFGMLHHKGQAVADTKANANLSVRIMMVQPQDKMLTRAYIGYVRPIHQVVIQSYIAGFLNKVNVSGGQDVKAGEILFEIQPDMYRAQSDLASAQVRQAQATLENAKNLYERMKNAGSRAVSKTDIDNAKTKVLTAEAALAEAKASEKIALVNEGYTVLRAPIDGKVGDITATIGDYVAPTSTPLADIIQYSPIRVQFAISNKDYLNDIMQNNNGAFQDWQVKLRLTDGRIYSQMGQIKYVNNAVNQGTASLEVYADFDNPNHILLPNAYVDILLEKNIKDGLFLPQIAVNVTSSGGVVYALSADNKITSKTVQIGQIIDGLFYIPSGLQPGDRIIMDKIMPYQVGQKATIREVIP